MQLKVVLMQLKVVLMKLRHFHGILYQLDLMLASRMFTDNEWVTSKMPKRLY